MDIFIAVAAALVMLGLIFIALSVLSSSQLEDMSGTLSVKADTFRFDTLSNRAAADSLAGIDDERDSHAEQQMIEALVVLRRRPREVYVAWAARTEIGFPGRLPTDPLW
jgi:hypothetical protein